MLKRLSAAFSLSLLSTVIALGGQVVAVPVYLAMWGAQLYGEWLALTSIVATLSVLNLGVQSYAGNLLIAHFARDEIAVGTAVLHAALRLYTVLAGLALLCVGGLTFWPGLPTLLKIEILSAVEVRTIIVTQGLIASYALAGGLLMGLFRATRQQPRQLMYRLVEQVIMLLAPICVALVGGRPSVASLVVMLLMAGSACVAFWDVRRRTPFHIGIGRTTWRAALALVRPSLAFFGTAAITSLITSGMFLLIAILNGGLAVALFATTLVLTNLFRTVIHQGLNILAPEITAAAATGAASLRRWHHLVQKVVGGVVLAGAATLYAFGPFILHTWTGGRIVPDQWLNALLVLYLIVQAPALVSQSFGLALNRPGDVLLAQFTLALCGSVLAVVCTQFAGLYGVPLALLISQLIATALSLALAARWTHDYAGRLAGATLLRGVPALLACHVAFIAVLAPGPLGAVAGFTAVVLVLLLWWAVWLTSAERGLLTATLARALTMRPVRKMRRVVP